MPYDLPSKDLSLIQWYSGADLVLVPSGSKKSAYWSGVTEPGMARTSP